jgi:hypothetical protein
MRLTPEQLALLYLHIEPKIADQFIEHHRALEAELDNWKDISGQAHDACIEAERDIARGQALREAAELTTTLDPRHDDIHGFTLALLSKSDAAEQDQSTREKYRADLIAEGWIGPVQAEQVAASLQRMTDLVRYARLFLHNEGLITDEEYTSIDACGESASNCRCAGGPNYDVAR